MERRLKKHCAALKGRRHRNPKVQAAFNKYGMQDERFLVVCEDGLQVRYEQDYIDANWGDSHYLNLDRYAQGGGGMLGKKGSDKQKARCKEVHTGKIVSEETKALISAAKSGVGQSAEHRANNAAARRGMRQSAEHRANNAAVRKGRPWSEARRAAEEAKKAAKVVTVAALYFD
jgi:hypothetical protein